MAEQGLQEELAQHLRDWKRVRLDFLDEKEWKETVRLLKIAGLLPATFPAVPPTPDAKERALLAFQLLNFAVHALDPLTTQQRYYYYY